MFAIIALAGCQEPDKVKKKPDDTGDSTPTQPLSCPVSSLVVGKAETVPLTADYLNYVDLNGWVSDAMFPWAEVPPSILNDVDGSTLVTFSTAFAWQCQVAGNVLTQATDLLPEDCQPITLSPGVSGGDPAEMDDRSDPLSADAWARNYYGVMSQHVVDDQVVAIMHGEHKNTLSILDEKTYYQGLINVDITQEDCPDLTEGDCLDSYNGFVGTMTRGHDLDSTFVDAGPISLARRWLPGRLWGQGVPWRPSSPGAAGKRIPVRLLP